MADYVAFKPKITSEVVYDNTGAGTMYFNFEWTFASVLGVLNDPLGDVKYDKAPELRIEHSGGGTTTINQFNSTSVESAGVRLVATTKNYATGNVSGRIKKSDGVTDLCISLDDFYARGGTYNDVSTLQFYLSRSYESELALNNDEGEIHTFTINDGLTASEANVITYPIPNYTVCSATYTATPEDTSESTSRYDITFNLGASPTVGGASYVSPLFTTTPTGVTLLVNDAADCSAIPSAWNTQKSAYSTVASRNGTATMGTISNVRVKVVFDVFYNGTKIYSRDFLQGSVKALTTYPAKEYDTVESVNKPRGYYGGDNTALIDATNVSISSADTSYRITEVEYTLDGISSVGSCNAHSTDTNECETVYVSYILNNEPSYEVAPSVICKYINDFGTSGTKTIKGDTFTIYKNAITSILAPTVKLTKVNNEAPDDSYDYNEQYPYITKPGSLLEYTVAKWPDGVTPDNYDVLAFLQKAERPNDSWFVDLKTPINAHLEGYMQEASEYSAAEEHYQEYEINGIPGSTPEHWFGHIVKNRIDRGFNLTHHYPSPVKATTKPLWKWDSAQEKLVSNIQYVKWSYAKGAFEIDSENSPELTSIDTNRISIVKWDGTMSDNYDDVKQSYYDSDLGKTVYYVTSPSELCYLCSGAGSTVWNSTTYGNVYKIREGIDAFDMGAYDEVQLDTTAEQLKAISEDEALYHISTAKQASWASQALVDINKATTETGVFDGIAFAGTLDFNGCVIYNLALKGNTPSLFPYIGAGAVIKNLVMKACRSWQWNDVNSTACSSGFVYSVMDNGAAANKNTQPAAREGDYNITFNNCAIIDCFGNTYGCGKHLLGSYIKQNSVTVNNCLFVNNKLEVAASAFSTALNSYTTIDDLTYFGGLVGGHYPGVNTSKELNVTNTIVIGDTLYPRLINPYAEYPRVSSTQQVDFSRVTKETNYTKCFEALTAVTETPRKTSNISNLNICTLRDKAAVICDLPNSDWTLCTCEQTGSFEVLPEFNLYFDLSKHFKLHYEDGTLEESYKMKRNDMLYVVAISSVYTDGTFRTYASSKTPGVTLSGALIFVRVLNPDTNEYEYKQGKMFVYNTRDSKYTENFSLFRLMDDGDSGEYIMAI